MREFILDHRKNIVMDLDNVPIKNNMSLKVLREGIFSLAQTIRELEIRRFGNGQTFELNADFNPLIPNCFNWFVINTTNYIRVIGLMDLMIQNNWKTKDILGNKREVKKYCTDYVKEVVPNLYKWRNKVVAHPSATDPQFENVATLESSLMQMITFQAPYFYLGGAKWSTNGGTTELEGWAITKLYEEVLCPRFWPNRKIEAFIS